MLGGGEAAFFYIFALVFRSKFSKKTLFRCKIDVFLVDFKAN